MIMQLPNKKKRIHGAYINSDYLCVYVNYFKRAGVIEAKSSDYGRLCHIYLDCYTTNHFIIYLYLTLFLHMASYYVPDII